MSVLSLVVLGLGIPQEAPITSSPRYKMYQAAQEHRQSIKSPPGLFEFRDDAFYYRDGSKTYRVDFKGKRTEVSEIPKIGDSGQGTTRPQNRPGAARGRQFDRAYSTDGKLMAQYKDRNVWMTENDGTPYALTTEGSVEKRTKCGIASWVYGEELGVREAMWFSPDGAKLATYYFDESKVKDYYLGYDQTQFQDSLDVEAYPKAGMPNPEVSLRVFDLKSKKETKVDTSFGDATLGCYVYDVRWSPDGKEIFFNRTNRKQNAMQFCAANPDTGACRVIVEEKWPQSWVENHPPLRYMSNDKDFIWSSERNGFQNLYWGNLDGRALKPITQHSFEVASIVKVDEKAKVITYMARDGDNPYKLQYHRIGFDGKGDVRLTDPQFHHRVTPVPNSDTFIDRAENATTPASISYRDANGKLLLEIGKSDMSEFVANKFKTVERIKFKAADGTTDLYGFVSFPTDFDPAKKYPLIVDVYGGPESGTNSETFRYPEATCELGYIEAWFDGRGTSGRGKAFKDAVYGKLGVVEIDDQAAGVKYLAQRSYIDASRVGIHGTSYGGYASLMCLVRHPEVFTAAVCGSPVTDWRHYDTIYTERYMGLPDAAENKSGYDAGSAMTYAKDLQGKLLLYFGTADNNVHPANTVMMAQALNRAGKSYAMAIGPDQGHTSPSFARTWEFFYRYLKLGE